MRRKPFAALLTEQEKAEIEAAAKAAGVSASAYLRDSASLRHQLQMSASKIERVEAERDAALAHVAELEAPGECASIHKLRAQVADLQSAIERVRPVVEALAVSCEAEAGDPEERPHVLAEVMIALGRPLTGFDEDAAWLRSLLPTAPESVPVLAPSQPAPAPDGRFTVDSAWRFE